MKTRALRNGDRRQAQTQTPDRLMLPEPEIREAIQRLRDNWPQGQTAGSGWRVYPVPSEDGHLIRVDLWLDDLERPRS